MSINICLFLPSQERYCQGLLEIDTSKFSHSKHDKRNMQNYPVINRVGTYIATK